MLDTLARAIQYFNIIACFSWSQLLSYLNISQKMLYGSVTVLLLDYIKHLFKFLIF